jgi:ElaB/YqjD/DUF883 family membrane-anchored ribosome-binding protein
MDETKKDVTPNPTQRSGSDTASAARLPTGAAIGSAGQPGSAQGHGATPMASSPQGSGWDTASAARISAGTSAGTVGQPPRPQEYRGASGSAGGQGSTQSNQSYAQGASDLAGDVRDRAGETLEQASDWAREQYEQGSRQLDRARDQSMRQLQQARGGIERFVSQNPLMVGVVGLAAGLVIGALLPRTRQEDRAFGEWSDQVRDQGLRYAREATQRGREYVEEALGNDSDEEWRPEDDKRGGGVRQSGPRYQNH